MICLRNTLLETANYFSCKHVLRNITWLPENSVFQIFTCFITLNTREIQVGGSHLIHLLSRRLSLFLCACVNYINKLIPIKSEIEIPLKIAIFNAIF